LIEKVFFIQDILNGDGNFLTFEEFQNKFRIKTNYLHYFQLMAAIPLDLKEKAMSAEVPSHEQLLQCSSELFELRIRVLYARILRICVCLYAHIRAYICAYMSLCYASPQVSLCEALFDKQRTVLE